MHNITYHHYLLGILLTILTFKANVALSDDVPSSPFLRLETGMHTAPINRIDLDAAQRYLVTGSDDKTVRVWSLADGQLVRVLRPPIGEGNEGKIYAVAISPDGQTVAAGGSTGYTWDNSHSIYLFNRASGELQQCLTGLPNLINHLTYSPDGRYLVACLGGKNGIRIYQTTDYRLYRQDTEYGDSSYWADFEPHGRLVTSAWDGYLRLYDAQFNLLNQRATRGGRQPYPYGVRFSPTGEKIAVGFADSTAVQVLSGQTLEVLYNVNTQGVDNGNLMSVAWSTAGETLYAGGDYRNATGLPILSWSQAGQGSYQPWSVSNDDEITNLRTLSQGGIVFGAADSAWGQLDGQGKRVKYRQADIGDFRDNWEGFLLSQTGETVQFAYEANGKRPAQFSLQQRTLTPSPTSADRGSLTPPRTDFSGVSVTDWKNSETPKLNGKPLPLQQDETSRSLAIAPDGQVLLLGTEWWLRLFDTQGQQRWEVPVPGIAWAVNIAGNGQVAVAAFVDGTIRWYRLRDGQELLAFFPHRNEKDWVLWTPQGYYDTNLGAEHALIGWHVNRGADQAAVFYPINQFRNYFYRPSRLDKLLETLEPLPRPEVPVELGGTAKTPPPPPVEETAPPPPPIKETAPPPPKPSPTAPTSQPSPPKTTLPSWLTWVVTFLLTLGGLLLLVPGKWLGIGLILLTLILFLWKIFPPFLRWLSPETPRMVANIIVGITVGIVTTAVIHYLWAAEPVSITGMIMAIVGWWLWGEHNRG
jgi:WD40 repeat protein